MACQASSCDIADARCQLTSYPVGRRFKAGTRLNTALADIFESIHSGTRNASLPVVSPQSSLHFGGQMFGFS